MNTRVKWVEGQRFVGSADSGHSIVIDASDDSTVHGKTALSPMQLILMGVGGCSGIDVLHILQRGRENVTDCVVEVDGTRADTDPKVFTDIHMTYIVTGKNLDPAKVDRAVKLSGEKYCSASVMLGQVANITKEIKIIEAE
ncbi:OsmC family protein [Curvivirga sp.]|uniref:OsmC family protein n=1 Tax=Curvivirga sp. TaxID=2856848 RepID=UPI003B597A84